MVYMFLMNVYKHSEDTFDLLLYLVVSLVATSWVVIRIVLDQILASVINRKVQVLRAGSAICLGRWELFAGDR